MPVTLITDENDSSRRRLIPAIPRDTRIWLDLVTLLVQRDLRVRYRGSFFGYLWSMMNPLLYMTILSFVFSHLMRFKIDNFSSFILSGILTWNLFQQSLAIGVNSIVANGSLLRKVKVPATLFPASSVCSVLVNFLLALVPYFIIGLATGLEFTRWILFLPVILVPYIAFIFGASLFVASLNVAFRDVGHTLDPILTIVFYATPIVYPVSSLPDRYQQLLGLNPLAHYVGAMRDVMFYGNVPSFSELGIVYLLAIFSVALGIFVYRKQRDTFIYNL